MYFAACRSSLYAVALLAEGVDRNRKPARPLYGLTPSPSSRRAWIEISQIRRSAPHTSSPSSRRAWIEIPLCLPRGPWLIVALLAEGVDRNMTAGVSCPQPRRSPSSRRAWIEIRNRPNSRRPPQVALLAEGVDRNWPGWGGRSTAKVALLAEGVDRNSHKVDVLPEQLASPSSRRAWIEMVSDPACGAGALRRPPRGGRG